MQARVTELLTLEGWTNTATPPDTAALVNSALALFSWDGEYLRGSADITMVANTHTYSLVSASAEDWKRVSAVAWVGGSGLLEQKSEEQLCNQEPEWFVQAAGTPRCYWLPKPNNLRVYPTPDASGGVLRVIGVRCEPTLSSGTSSPLCPKPFHDNVCQVAAAIYAKPYALSADQVAKVQSWLDAGGAGATAVRSAMISNHMPFARRGIESGGMRVRV